MQPDHIEVEINAWIIQDGNYGEFAIGDELTIAFEFGADSMFKTANKTRSIKQIDAAAYEVCAQIIFYAPEVWAIDFGIPAFQELKPPEGYQVGDWITCEVSLGIDPFFYKERLQWLSGMPNLFNRWRVAGIDLETSAWIETRPDTGGVYLTRGTPRSWRSVGQTDAWQDDGGSANYRLALARMPE